MNTDTKNEDSEIDARTSLLKAGASLFAEQGYSATGVQQITDAAKVNKAMLYYYFNSKEALYDLLIEQGVTAINYAVSIAESADMPMKIRLSSFIRTLLEIVRNNPDLGRIIYRELSGAGEHKREKVAMHLSGAVCRLANILEKANIKNTDPTLSAYSLFGMVMVFITSHFVTGRELEIDRVVNHITELFLHGVEIDM